MLVGGDPPIRNAGKPIVASSAATMRSQCCARSVPPARQCPWIWAITGSWAFQILDQPREMAKVAMARSGSDGLPPSETSVEPMS